MANRILDISESPAQLRVRHENLIVELQGEQSHSVPLADIAVLVISHPQVRFTHAVVSGMVERGGVLITCGANRLPVGMLLPLVAHFAQAERFAAQARATNSLQKRLWQQIVKTKIAAQARLLRDYCGDDGGLSRLVSEVRSGDSTNVEARAARKYWHLLFADKQFRRDREMADENSLLNYGYAVLRAIVARAICGSGLHPGLGIHHHNRYSGYPLADDLMEPLRPAVDRAVVELLRERNGTPSLTPEAKRHLLQLLLHRYDVAGEQRTLFDAASRAASSLVDCFLGCSRQLLLPVV